MKHAAGALDAGWEKQSFEFRSLVALARRHILPLILLPVVCVMLGFVYMVVTTPLYSSSASLSVDMGGTQGEAMNAALESHMEAIRSNRVALDVLDRLGITDIELERGKLDRLIGAVRNALGFEMPEEMSDDDKRAFLADWLASALEVWRVGDSTIIRITYSSESPSYAAEVANAFADAYVDSLVSRSVARAERRADFLKTRVDEIRNQAASSYQEVQQIRSRDGLELEDFEDLDTLAAWLREVRSGISEAEISIATRLSLMESADELQSLEAAALLTEGGADLYYAYREALSSLERLREEGAAADHIARLETSVEQLRRDLDRLVTRERRSLEQQLAIQTARRESIAHDFDSELLQKRLRNWAEIVIAEHRGQVFQNIYADHLRELENVYGQAGEVPIHVMGYAQPSFQPTSPNYKLVLVMSVVLGLVLGVALAMFREWRASRAASMFAHRQDAMP